MRLRDFWFVLDDLSRLAVSVARQLLVVAVITFSMAVLCPPSEAHTVGNPGDLLRLETSMVRSQLVDVLGDIDSASFADMARPTSASFFGQFKDRVVRELAAAEFVWLLEERVVCALAFAPVQQTPGRIEFSYPQCNATLRQIDDIVVLLLHESVHLVGFADETLADEFALDMQTYLEATRRGSLDIDPITRVGAPSPRAHAASVLFYDKSDNPKLFVWGGTEFLGNDVLDDGAIYDVTRNEWQALPPVPSTLGSGPLGRWGASAVIVSEPSPRVMIFGGENSEKHLADLLIYELETKQWTRQDFSQEAGLARVLHFAAATPRGLLIYGGVSKEGNYMNDGFIYDGSIWHKLPATVHSYKSGIAYSGQKSKKQVLYVLGSEHPIQSGTQTDEKLAQIDLTSFEVSMSDSADPFDAPFGYTLTLTSDRLISWSGEASQSLWYKDTGTEFLLDKSASGQRIYSANSMHYRTLHTSLWWKDRLFIYGGVAIENQLTNVLNTVRVQNGQLVDIMDSVELPNVGSVALSADVGIDFLIFWGGFGSGQATTNYGVVVRPSLLH